MAVAPAPPATAGLPARRSVAWPGLFKDAVVAALIAGLLGLPFIGLETYDIGGGALGVRTHFERLAIVVASVFVGRFAIQLFRQRRYPGVPGSGQKLARVAGWSSRRAVPITIIGVAVAVALPFLPFSSRYLVDLGTTVLIYVMLGWGLNIVVGLAGLLDLGYVAFYAVGAYTFALLARDLGFGFWEALPFSGVMAALFGLLLGFPVLRLRGDYLAIVTLGFGEIVRLVLLNWYTMTGGPNGLSVPRPSFFGLPFARRAPDGGMTFSDLFGIEFSAEHRVIFLYYLILVLALITNFFTLRIRRLPVGRAWEALREDEIGCRALGINPTNIKLSAFALGAMFGGLAGCFFATRQGFISPESFTFIESATILAIVVLGGMGSQLGVVLAALVLVTLPEFGRAFAEFRMLVFGAAMVVIMVWRPRGLLSHREPSVYLHPPAATGALR